VKITQTSDAVMSASRQYSDAGSRAAQQYRVYYGDGGGGEIESRNVAGLVNRQVRE
jgi:hypothetical protein